MFGSRKSRPVQEPPTSFRFAFPIDIDRPAAEVWTLVKDPRHTKRFRDDVVSAVTLPGTGEGVGEVQAFVYRHHGRLSGSFIEIVEYEPGRRAVHRSLDEKLPVQLRETRTETLVESLTVGRSRLTHAVTVHAATGYVLTPAIVAELEVGYATFWHPLNERIRDVLDGSGDSV